MAKNRFFLLMLGNTASVLLVSACSGLVLALDWRAHYVTAL